MKEKLESENPLVLQELQIHIQVSVKRVEKYKRELFKLQKVIDEGIPSHAEAFVARHQRLKSMVFYEI